MVVWANPSGRACIPPLASLTPARVHGTRPTGANPFRECARVPAQAMNNYRIDH